MIVEEIKRIRDSYKSLDTLICEYFNYYIKENYDINSVPYYQFKSWKYGRVWDNDIVIYYNDSDLESCEMDVTFEELEKYSENYL